jgi:photosystem II stability/assembly factor-like uncharacterized protein
MKKVYFFLLTLIVGGIIGCFLFYSETPKSSLTGEALTPKQIREAELNYKREKRERGEAKADKPDEFTKYFKGITTKFGEKDNNYPLNYRIEEFSKSKAILKAMKSNPKFTPIWEERGPGNVGGRTRGLIVDPDDATNNTWFAAAVGGGVWKTVDGGQSWTCLTDNLPNLSANALAMSESNHNIIYLGTGEGFYNLDGIAGNGVFKSIDKGDSWTQLSSTVDNNDFKYINRLAIDPTNPDIVIVVTNTGIFKSIDGGTSWSNVYTGSSRIQDLKEDPNDFNILYATENGVGVLKSTDAGDNWVGSSDGISGGSRFELAVSPANTSVIYVSQELSGESYVYRSVNAGATWIRFEDKDGLNIDFLSGQGWYDNTIAAHPYDEGIAFLGGVNLWKVDFSDPGTVADSDPLVKDIVLDGISSFMSFINFGGSYLGGGMELGTNNNATDITESEYVSVEIRFGTGMSQRAHRFTVGGVGSGVPASDYIYEDYVDVPFEVWDVTNNKQLMASFRDQEEDGKFDLVARDASDGSIGREYLFINLVDYSVTASPDIASNAGHSYKQMYFFWPTLADGGVWNDAALPDSKIFIDWGSIQLTKGTTYNVSDGYGQFGGNNSDLHVDHHNIMMIPINEVTDSFLILNANDGGLGISYNSGVTFDQLSNDYITTQFYGAAKKPGANEYIGGMQDNGTWRSPDEEDASVTTNYLYQIGGDGFECIWHSQDDQKIIGGSQNNHFWKTTDGGSSWSNAQSGLSDDGPFLSRLSTNRNSPDILFTVGENGVYKSTNFGSTWSMKTIDEGWSGVSSYHNVEVSIANENIVWAGASMATTSGYSIFVSTDQGESYTAIPDFTDANLNGYISGIATHPYEDSTAYLLFSFSDEPKVLRTKDLGQTWEDLSGFVGNTSSDNGFPNVATQSLVVLPNNPLTLWVGTDIGLFESNDDGATWHYADNGLPAVSMYDMFVQDGQVVVATHGRGIWSASIEELNYVPELSTAAYEGFEIINADVTVIDAVDSIKIYINDELISIEETVVAGLNSFEIPVTVEGDNKIYVKAFNL